MRTQRKCQKKKKINKKHISKWKKVCSAIAAVALFGSSVATIIYYSQEIGKNLNPSYDYDLNTEWMDMEVAFNLLTEKSGVSIYTSSRIIDNHTEDSFYFEGVSLVALFSNKEDVERNIIKFSVFVDDIEENLSPDIECVMVEDNSDPITAHFSNTGWGDTGEIHLSIKDVLYNDNSVADISILEGVENDWIFESIPPGETRVFTFADTKIFNVIWKDYSVESTNFSILVDICAPKTGYSTSCVVTMKATPDGVVACSIGGEGGDGDVNYVILVDTSMRNWASTYNIYQRIPAKQTVRLPIFIMPTKSCSMSIRVEFELEDGEIIIANPLYHVPIRVPYYTELTEYISGETLDWNALEGNAEIWFPYEMNSKVLPGMELK